MSARKLDAIDPLDAADARDALALAAYKLAKLSRAFESVDAIDAKAATDAARDYCAQARRRAADAAAHAIAETRPNNNDEGSKQ
jgi:hypothetical protein